MPLVRHREKVFTSQAGSRPESKKLMIVITDGESNDYLVTFPEALKAADDKGIIRYAIGVGNLFHEVRARKELEIIGSKPSKDFVFQVDSYAALKEIEDSLKDKIFAIEGGSNSLNTSSFQRELAQTGFSSLYTKDSIFLGSVGSYDWAGEVVEIRNGKEITIRPSIVEPNAYFGYTLAGIYHEEGLHLVVGAPRHDHKGAVFIQERVSEKWRTRQIIKGEQVS
ncbi:integrin alpha-D-like [Leucoraja erinacea]|uniref:integrin alpha-D-like n=1 Tax=Leucoraja erinaceus TaxID=7782 RepID=UPI002456040C|nr:integrin alpha-D-like [Leucoraja erinacea]